VALLQTQNTGQQARINTLIGQNVVQQAQIGILQVQNAAQQTQINGMQTQNAAQQTQISALQVDVAALQGSTALVTALEPYVSVDTNPINGLGGPHIVFTGANVHIRSGSGSTDDGAFPGEGGTLTGLGNLVIGYNEPPDLLDPNDPLAPGDRGGSHNIIVGEYHRYGSAAGLVAGHYNTISFLGFNASVSGGFRNTASRVFSSVSGGRDNTAAGPNASVSGGSGNTANGFSSSVNGGDANTASGTNSSISGGSGNTATAAATFANISGGSGNTVSDQWASVSGGANNTASGLYSSVSGGAGRTAPSQFNWTAGSLLESQ
jgi:hypothetical protein